MPSDRLEVDDLLTRYATAIDTGQWDMLDTVFTPDATIDYRSAGGIAGSYPEVKEWLAAVLSAFDMTQHMVLNRDVQFTGDTGTGRSLFLNPNRLTVDGNPWLFVVGGCYHDRFSRTPDGWRIVDRLEEALWWDNPPPGLPPVPPGLPSTPG